MNLKSLTLGVAALAASALAVPLSTGTGVNTGNWQLAGNPAVALGNNIPIGIWLTPFGPVGNQWVGPSATAGTTGAAGAPTTYVYTLVINAGSGTTNVQYAADNRVTWTVTGGGSVAGANTVCNQADCFRALNGAPRSFTLNYVPGSVLTATVINDALGGANPDNPTGLLVVGETVPEPSTYAMLGLGGAALLLSRLRRK